MIFATGFIVFVIGETLCEWNATQPYTWKDRWLPHIPMVGIWIMLGSIVTWLSTFLP